MGTSNIELINMAKHYKLKLNGVHEKDQLPNTIIKGWYIVNMQNHNAGNGTHWVCFYHDTKSVYIDSFGVVPPLEIINVLNNNYIHNTKQIQDYNNEDCGLYCICAMLFWSQFYLSSNIKILAAYNKMFSISTKMNTMIMKNFLYQHNKVKPENEAINIQNINNHSYLKYWNNKKK
jgi:hypothetical protein